MLVGLAHYVSKAFNSWLIIMAMRFLAFMTSPLVNPWLGQREMGKCLLEKKFFHAGFNSSMHKTCPSHIYCQQRSKITVHVSHTHCIPLTHWLTDSTELNVSAAHKTTLEYFEMNTKDAYSTNTAEITTTENAAYMPTDDAIPATQNVYEQVPPGTDDCYEYVI